MNIDRIVKEIKDGNLVIAPTDTVYGILADACNRGRQNHAFQQVRHVHRVHDADFLLSLTGGKVLSVRSQGSLMRYRKESAPGEAATRCINCPLQRSCRFSAVDLYLRRKEWVSGFDIPDGSTLEAVIKEELLKGRYGRCVYHCDNNVFDYQKVSVELDRLVSLSMTLDGLADKEGREMHIRGTEGTLDLIGETLTIRSGKAVRQEDFPADRRILEDFFASLRENRPMEASLDGSLEAHRLCFLAD